MRGIDVSHWQGSIDWAKVRAAGYEFAFAKATQGVSMVDQTYKANRDGARKAGILFGSYHFANGGDAKAEADHFVKTANDIRTSEILILDWEIEHSQPIGWCVVFLNRVFEKTGVRPLLYTNADRVNRLDWSPVVNGNYGLWVARYPKIDMGIYIGLLKPDSGEWPFFAIWQYSSKGKVSGISGNVDLNDTSMDIETLKRYGKKPGAPVECNHQCPLHCNQ